MGKQYFAEDLNKSLGNTVYVYEAGVGDSFYTDESLINGYVANDPSSVEVETDDAMGYTRLVFTFLKPNANLEIY